MTGTRKNQPQEQEKDREKDWTQDRSLRGIDPVKLQLLNSIAAQGSRKGIQELLPFLMSAVSQNQNKPGGMHFTQPEVDAIIQVLKTGKSPEETARMERMLQLIKTLR
ncbi:MAG: hypothetical protein ACI4EO_02035 [Blautia sp.]